MVTYKKKGKKVVASVNLVLWLRHGYKCFHVCIFCLAIILPAWIELHSIFTQVEDVLVRFVDETAFFINGPSVCIQSRTQCECVWNYLF